MEKKGNNEMRNECIATLEAALEMIRSKCDIKHPEIERVVREQKEETKNPNNEEQKKLAAKIRELKNNFAFHHRASLSESVEFGFFICKVNEELVPGRTCRGRKDCVIMNDCNEHEVIGMFHTHPEKNDTPELSALDIIHGIQRGWTFNCISGYDSKTDREIVKCYKYLKNSTAYHELKWWCETLYDKVGFFEKMKEEYKRMVEEYKRGKIPHAKLKKSHDDLVKQADNVGILYTAIEHKTNLLEGAVEPFVDVSLDIDRKLEPKTLKIDFPPL